MENINIWRGTGTIVSIKTVPINDPRGTYYVTDITLKIQRLVKGQAKATLIPLEAWGVMSEKCNHLQEGDPLSVEGRFENKRWTNKNQETQSKNLIVVEKIYEEEDTLAEQLQPR